LRSRRPLGSTGRCIRDKCGAAPCCAERVARAACLEGRTAQRARTLSESARARLRHREGARQVPPLAQLILDKSSRGHGHPLHVSRTRPGGTPEQIVRKLCVGVASSWSARAPRQPRHAGPRALTWRASVCERRRWAGHRLLQLRLKTVTSTRQERRRTAQACR
jgi:hypothetical protein